MTVVIDNSDCWQALAQAGPRGAVSVARAHGAAVPRDAAQGPRRHPRVHLRGDTLGHARARPRCHLQGLLLRAPALGGRLQSHRRISRLVNTENSPVG